LAIAHSVADGFFYIGGYANEAAANGRVWRLTSNFIPENLTVVSQLDNFLLQSLASDTDGNWYAAGASSPAGSILLYINGTKYTVASLTGDVPSLLVVPR
jgi:hypothetical protein